MHRREDAGATRFQALGGVEGSLERSQLRLVHATRALLAVTSYERHGAAVVEECDRAGHTPPLHLEQSGALANDGLLRLCRERAGVHRASALRLIVL